MKRLLFALSLYGLFLGIAGGCQAGQNESSPADGKSSLLAFSQAALPVKAKLVLEHDRLLRGSESRIGVLFEIEDGWHIYAADPGDAGMPTRVEWQLPEGFTASPLIWREPETFMDPGDIRTYGYTEEALVSSLLQIGPDAPGGEQVFRAEAAWLACSEICVPGKASLEAKAAVGDTPRDSEDASLFREDVE